MFSTNGAPALHPCPAQPPTSHLSDGSTNFLSFRTRRFRPEAGEGGPEGRIRDSVRSGREARRKLGMDLPEVLSPLSLPPPLTTSPPTQCGEEELRDLYLSPPPPPCMPPPGYSAPARTPGGLRGGVQVDKQCLQSRREQHGAVEPQQQRSELRPAQKWTNSNSALYNNSIG